MSETKKLMDAKMWMESYFKDHSKIITDKETLLEFTTKVIYFLLPEEIKSSIRNFSNDKIILCDYEGKTYRLNDISPDGYISLHHIAFDEYGIPCLTYPDKCTNYRLYNPNLFLGWLTKKLANFELEDTVYREVFLNYFDIYFRDTVLGNNVKNHKK